MTTVFLFPSFPSKIMAHLCTLSKTECYVGLDTVKILMFNVIDVLKACTKSLFLYFYPMYYRTQVYKEHSSIKCTHII